MLNIINTVIILKGDLKIVLELNCPANGLNFEREKNLTGNSPDLLKVCQVMFSYLFDDREI